MKGHTVPLLALHTVICVSAPSISFQDQAQLLLRLENIWILVLPSPIPNPIPASQGSTEQSQGQQLGWLSVEVGEESSA